MLYLVASRERAQKQGRICFAFQQGIRDRETKVIVDDPPDPTQPFIAVGQLWVVERIVPPAMVKKVPFWLCDNGYYRLNNDGAMGKVGCYEMTYRGLVPILMDEPDYSRWPGVLKPWRKPTPDGHVVIGLPGVSFGRVIGLDMESWMSDIVARVSHFTNRRIVVREKYSTRPLEQDLAGCHCLVTHSSNVGVDAIRHGIPVICAPTNPAAPVCSQSLADIENPPTPDRTQWWASLMSQQYTYEEMQSGVAWEFMKRVAAQVDG